MENIEDIIKRLSEYYGVSGITKLANKLGVSQPVISSWKARNSINSVKKRCRELDIYKDIFKNTPNKTAKDLIDKLMEFYEVNTLSELGKCINISQPNISTWITKNSIESIKKKSRELGIYNYLFDDFEVDLFQNLEDYTYEEKRRILYQNCKKYDIQTTTIENKRLLYLIEKFDKDYNLEVQEKLEEIIKDLYLKSGKFYQYLDEKGKKEILQDLEKNINKFEEKINKN